MELMENADLSHIAQSCLGNVAHQAHWIGWAERARTFFAIVTGNCVGASCVVPSTTATYHVYGKYAIFITLPIVWLPARKAGVIAGPFVAPPKDAFLVPVVQPDKEAAPPRPCPQVSSDVSERRAACAALVLWPNGLRAWRSLLCALQGEDALDNRRRNTQDG